MRDLGDYFKNYVEKNFDHILSDFRKKFEIEIIKKLKPKIILEIGCGLNPLFLDYENFEYLIIVEPTEGFCKFALEKLDNEYAHLKNRIQIVNKPIQEFKIANLQPDFVMCAGLIGEFRDPKEIIDAVYNICNLETTAYISAPNANSFHRLLALEAGFIDNVNTLSQEQIKFQRHLVFDRKSISNHVQKSGFKITEIGTYYVKPFTNLQMIALLENNIINQQVLEGLNNMIKYMPNLGAEIYVCVKKE